MFDSDSQIPEEPENEFKMVEAIRIAIRNGWMDENGEFTEAGWKAIGAETIQ